MSIPDDSDDMLTDDFDDEPPPLILGGCRDGMVLQPGEGCRYSGGDSSQINVVLSVRLDGAICREGDSTKQELGSVTLDVGSLRLCSTGGFERDDAFQSGIVATANADGSWTFYSTGTMVGEEPTVEAVPLTPGEGISVNMGRAGWSSGYFQAEVYRQLLQELGYTVSDPAELELPPDNGYLAMAEGDMDFWVNSWYPGHLSWLAGELPDGSLVGDHLSILGEQIVAGGLQGFLVTKSFADEFGVYSMDALNEDAEALAAFDATDPVPGNGIADIFGCPESWTCDNIITAQILFSGWDNINQTIAGYDAMLAQAVDAANEGVPMVAYTWTPSAYIADLRPGDNVYWMGVENVLDDSNPEGVEGGEEYDQRGPDGTGGYAAIGADQCPTAADNVDGLCPIGWIANDILVTANSNFIDADPAVKALLEAVKLSVIEVSLARFEQDNGAALGGLASAWIAENRTTVDAWLQAARVAHLSTRETEAEVPNPSAPAAPMVTASTDTAVVLVWFEPADTGPAVNDYDIGYRRRGTTAWTTWPHTGTTRTATITGLTADATYEIRVRARSPEGTSKWSTTTTAATSQAETTTSGDTANVDCYVGLVVALGERCTYPGSTQDFRVDDSGRGHFIFFTAGTGISARGTNINGIIYNFAASKQPDGTWIIEAAG